MATVTVISIMGNPILKNKIELWRIAELLCKFMHFRTHAHQQKCKAISKETYWKLSSSMTTRRDLSEQPHYQGFFLFHTSKRRRKTWERGFFESSLNVKLSQNRFTYHRKTAFYVVGGFVHVESCSLFSDIRPKRCPTYI